MAYRLILVLLVSLLALFGCGGQRLVERELEGVGRISLPSSAKPVGDGSARDEDPSRLYFRFAHEYPWWDSLGSGTAYKQVLCVSLFAPTAAASDYETWPPRFEPLYRDLKRQRTVELGNGTLQISAGHYAQNALDEPAHVYLYWDRSRRMQIAWHTADKVVAPDDALKLIERMAASFELRTDPLEKFAELAGRGERERQRAAAAVQLARDTLARAGFGAAAPGEPVYANGVYVEWMAEPEPRFQLVKPLGLVRASGSVAVPRRPDGVRGSIGWRQFEDGAWVSHNRDNDYWPLPGIERALAERQTDEATTLYYFARTVRVEVEDEATIAALGSFFDELPGIESAWRDGTLVDAERFALPEAPEPAASVPASGAAVAVPPAGVVAESPVVAEAPVVAVSPAAAAPTAAIGRFAFGIDLQTGNPHLDSVRRRLASAAYAALPLVRVGDFAAADAAVLAVDREIQSSVMLGAMYTEELRAAVARGERESRPEFVTALHAHALRWRFSAYPEPHTAYEGDAFEAGRAADRAELAAILSAPRDEA